MKYIPKIEEDNPQKKWRLEAKIVDLDWKLYFRAQMSGIVPVQPKKWAEALSNHLSESIFYTIASSNYTIECI